jgi:uncharacterized membrane protein
MAAAIAWSVSIALAPWADSLPPAGGFTARAVAAVYLAGGIVCHQRADRSFHSQGAQWPVCARCAGLYFSGAAGVAWAWSRRARRGRVPFHAWRALLAAAAVPTLVTIALEWVDPAWSSPALRAMAALPLGASAGVLLGESMSFRGKLAGCERMP